VSTPWSGFGSSRLVLNPVVDSLALWSNLQIPKDRTSLLHTGQVHEYDADIPTEDINGNLRPTMSPDKPDMGAYESDYYTCP
jgi:hypothetical protein